MDDNLDDVKLDMDQDEETDKQSNTFVKILYCIGWSYKQNFE